MFRNGVSTFEDSSAQDRERLDIGVARTDDREPLFARSARSHGRMLQRRALEGPGPRPGFSLPCYGDPSVTTDEQDIADDGNHEHSCQHRVYAAVRANLADARPRRRIAVVTCMDARIDVFAALGLRLGDAHIIRNAGGR